MADDALNTCVVEVGRSLRGGQHEARVEDVQRLVLHGSHVEVVHRHDVELVEVVLAPEALLVPAHGRLQGFEGVARLGDVVRLGPYAEQDLAARHGRETVFPDLQLARHDGEEVARLGMGVGPRGGVASSPDILTRLQVSV